MRVLVRILAAAALLSSAPAWADKHDFPRCDGFKAPNKRVDNMLQESSLWGLMKGSATGRKAGTLIGQSGLAACEAALQNPLLLPKYWQRRAHLLQSKALHLVQLKRYDDALAALDESKALADINEDLLFEESSLLGGLMIRSVALWNLDRKDEARAALAKARKVRPHANSIIATADRIENSFEEDVPAAIARWKPYMALDPNLISRAFNIYLFRGEIEEAAVYEDDVSLKAPKAISGWTVSGENRSGYNGDYKDAELKAKRAYILDATGKAEKAGALNDEITETVKSLRIPPPPPREGKKQRKSVLRDFETRKLVATRIENMASTWANAAKIRQRAVAGNLSLDDVAMDLKKHRVGSTGALYDILRQLKPETEAQKTELSTLLTAFDKAVGRTLFQTTNAKLFKTLPRPESLKLVPKFSRAGDGILLGREIGYSQAKEKDSDARTIRFGTGSGSLALAEELGMLAVAEYAKQENADSFIILSRRSVVRTTTVSGYYGGGHSYPSGYESQMRVLLLNSDSLPADLEPKRWRLIMVKDIVGALQPRFDKIYAAKAALKKKKR